jgi:hypothetical protein
LGTTISTVLFEKRFCRFSPVSLDLAPYDPAIWHVRLLPFCPTSWEILMEKCPFCAKRSGWQLEAGSATTLDLLVRLIPVVGPILPRRIPDLLQVDPLVLCHAIT